MSQVPADKNDSRSRYTHQAYDVTYFGKAMETGPSGYGSRLSGSYTALVPLSADAGDTAPQTMGDLTSGMAILNVVNHKALTGGTAIISAPAYAGKPEMIITGDPVDLSAAGISAVSADALAPLDMDRPIIMTIAGGTNGETAIVSLMATPIESGWK
ncbi:MAG: hypothetical protein GY813_09435 [Halieaceae bacterium]|nr:hypothetical protein [Halieaceae bacterium]